MSAQSLFANLLDKAHETKSVKEILALSPSALQGVSEKDAELLKQAFGIKTIQDMAENKFFQAANALNALAVFAR